VLSTYFTPIVLWRLAIPLQFDHRRIPRVTNHTYTYSYLLSSEHGRVNGVDNTCGATMQFDIRLIIVNPILYAQNKLKCNCVLSTRIIQLYSKLYTCLYFNSLYINTTKYYIFLKEVLGPVLGS
jgi:hypothetical protein